MTPEQRNQLLLEHKFLAKVGAWLEEGGSGHLTDTAAELAVKELWEHWVGIMSQYKDEHIKNFFMHELDEVIGTLRDFQKELS